jgi:hypothetical protein
MGTGVSTPVHDKFAETVLTKIFRQTDMMTYLTTTDPTACAKLDLSELSPALKRGIQASGGQVQLAGQNTEKIAVCFKQAKGYSMAFDIFAALYANLADVEVKRAGVALLGGMRTRRNTRRTQRGGAEISSTASKGYSLLKDTSLYPLWFLDGFTIDYEQGADMFKITLNITKEGRKGIQFTIPRSSLRDTNISVQAIVYNRTSQPQIPPCTITITKTGSSAVGADETFIFSINDTPVMEFDHGSEGWYLTQIVEGKADDPNLVQLPLKGSRKGVQSISQLLIKKIKDLVGINDGSGTAAVSTSYGATVPSYSTSSYGVAQGRVSAPISGSSGSFFPQGVANIRGIMRNISDKKRNTPIALAIARALILLRQIDPANAQGGRFTTQVCSSRYTFEGKDAHVPRKGLPLDKSYYFKSWMNLYNDIGELRQGKYEWTQSTLGKQQLSEAAGDLSILYSNPNVSSQRDPNFLSKPLPEFIVACQNKLDREFIIAPQVFPSIQKIVQELLKVQRDYIQKANAILATIFIFKADGTVSFHPAILGVQGYDYMSQRSVEARNTLFEYYMKVESLFIQGVMIYEQAQKVGLFQPV